MLLRVGITGHTRLSVSTSAAVYRDLIAQLGAIRVTALHGISCLAAGADQLFVRAVMAAGGTYEAILPAEDYRDRVVESSCRSEFDELTAGATSVSCMPFETSSRAAYMAASEELIRRSDRLFAVWDGTRSGRVGETGHVVAAARQRQVPVTVVWPVGAARE
jgi:hypothetical protein